MHKERINLLGFSYESVVVFFQSIEQPSFRALQLMKWIHQRGVLDFMQMTDFSLELRTRDRERKLQKKIQQSLKRIENGSYGYCEETGEKIGLKRLEARPVATLSLEAQERREITEKQYSDINDYLR